GSRYGAFDKRDDPVAQARVEAEHEIALAAHRAELGAAPARGRGHEERADFAPLEPLAGERLGEELELPRAVVLAIEMLEHAAAAAAEMAASRARAPRSLGKECGDAGGVTVRARFTQANAHAIAGQREGHVEPLPAFQAGDAVSARADLLDRDLELELHADLSSRRAAMRNSLLPSAPSIGLATMPSTVQPGRAAMKRRMRSHASSCKRASRTTPPFPTCPGPTSNWGLMRATRKAPGAASANGAGSSVSRPMKLASQ